MADPIPSKQPTVSESERKELEAYRAAQAREKAIDVEFAKRQEIAKGMIPEKMLREIAARQVDEDARRAAEQKQTAV